MKNILFCIVVLATSACVNNSKKIAANTSIFWVNSLKAECVGVAPMQCLQIQKGERMQSDKWEFLYNQIEGFEFEQGYIYKLEVKEEKIPAAQVPADASSIKYTLVRVIEKEKDATLALHDIWALETLDGNQINLEETQRRPQLEINLTKNMAIGNDGCNNFTGGIKSVDPEHLVFAPIAGTRMACRNMELSSTFGKNLSATASYSIKNLKLYLYDAEGKELMRFQKVD